MSRKGEKFEFVGETLRLLVPFKIELTLLLLSLIFFIGALSLFLTVKIGKKPIVIESGSGLSEKPAVPKILVDIEGAVEKPDVYEVTVGARLKDVLVQAGGLSARADREFFTRTFNLAHILKDQEKLYIPSSDEIDQNRNVILQTEKLNSGLININTASAGELDQLAGVGEITAEKIIQNRPYQTIDDLLKKKVVGKSVYEKIKDQITVN